MQNADLYDEGLSPGARDFIALRPEQAGARERILDLFTVAGTRSRYETGVADLEHLAPDGWVLDQYFLESPGRADAQAALAFDYHSNLAAYPRRQAHLRALAPPTPVLWGEGDPFFPEPGAHAYLRDLPEAEVHVLDTGHFALEERLSEMAPLITDFLDRLPEGGRNAGAGQALAR
ncbi:alpha/beta hydrolase [Nocardiopsis sp. N85]|uniref:alpha/beta fold hydrolase n=1 Tax=Nocardiopsis sp. N85 TaxID=3029400 RepID=UPI00237F7033|nr:alpha/beta hydrolase [Nocardiopsis sp. N85]MDE3722093.1 alpha/beta hydrolase [Nocardiopsis sp. N85]